MGSGPVVVFPWVILVLVGGSQVVQQHFLREEICMQRGRRDRDRRGRKGERGGEGWRDREGGGER